MFGKKKFRIVKLDYPDGTYKYRVDNKFLFSWVPTFVREVGEHPDCITVEPLLFDSITDADMAIRRSEILNHDFEPKIEPEESVVREFSL